MYIAVIAIAIRMTQIAPSPKEKEKQGIGMGARVLLTPCFLPPLLPLEESAGADLPALPP